MRGFVLILFFFVYCFLVLLFFGVLVFFGLDDVGFLIFRGIGFCFVLDILSGVNWVFIEGEGGFIFIVFMGVGW